jgi:hypothetical protein
MHSQEGGEGREAPEQPPHSRPPGRRATSDDPPPPHAPETTRHRYGKSALGRHERRPTLFVRFHSDALVQGGKYLEAVANGLDAELL